MYIVLVTNNVHGSHMVIGSMFKQYQLFLIYMIKLFRHTKLLA